jgi:protein SCO1/2
MTTDTLTEAQLAPGDDWQSSPPAARSLRRRDVVSLLGLVAAVGVVAWLVIPSGSPKLRLPGNATSSQTSRFAGATLSPVNPAPPLSLRSYLGDQVNVGAYRGSAVLVTFLYTHCPDVCPLTAAKLHNALLSMPAKEASHVEIIAVSVDPRGDNRVTVKDFLRAHAMTGRMKYLIGSPSELGRVWAAWNVGSQRESASPALVAHSALVYGISASGKLITIYPASFDPADIVHDVARLAAS